MFRAISLLKSPSTIWVRSITSLILFTSSSVKSLTRVSGFTFASARIRLELPLPHPYLSLHPISTPLPSSQHVFPLVNLHLRYEPCVSYTSINFLICLTFGHFYFCCLPNFPYIAQPRCIQTASQAHLQQYLPYT